VPERCQCPVTLVDGLGYKKYAPANLAANAKAITTVTKLEAKLMQRARIPECPLKPGGHECQCAKRDASAVAPASVAA
jgi:hypothetical protein